MQKIDFGQWFLFIGFPIFFARRLSHVWLKASIFLSLPLIADLWPIKHTMRACKEDHLATLMRIIFAEIIS